MSEIYLSSQYQRLNQIFSPQETRSQFMPLLRVEITKLIRGKNPEQLEKFFIDNGLQRFADGVSLGGQACQTTTDILDLLDHSDSETVVSVLALIPIEKRQNIYPELSSDIEAIQKLIQGD